MIARAVTAPRPPFYRHRAAEQPISRCRRARDAHVAPRATRRATRPTLSKMVHSAGHERELHQLPRWRAKGPFCRHPARAPVGSPSSRRARWAPSGSANHIPVASARLWHHVPRQQGRDDRNGVQDQARLRHCRAGPVHAAVVSTLTCQTCHRPRPMAWFGVTIKTPPPGTVGHAGCGQITLRFSDRRQLQTTCHANTNLHDVLLARR